MKLVATLAICAFAWGQDAEKLIQANDCSSCHALDRQVVGPAYTEMAKRYNGQPDAPVKIAAKIRDGGGGMTPHPNMTDAQRAEIANWILSRKDSAAGSAETKTYRYTAKDGSAVTLDFPLFLDDRGPKVTREVFHGYQFYNSYCYRCHGTDATGGQLGPDLRRSLATGMTQRDFMAVAMTGRKEKGMPAWAGFLTEDDVIHIFRYVKGRSVELVPSGRPASGQD